MNKNKRLKKNCAPFFNFFFSFFFYSIVPGMCVSYSMCILIYMGRALENQIKYWVQICRLSNASNQSDVIKSGVLMLTVSTFTESKPL